MTSMTHRNTRAVVFAWLLPVPTGAQASAPTPPPLTAGTRAFYSKSTELFAEWRRLIVGTATPDRFEVPEVTTGRTIGEAVQIMKGWDGNERVVTRGAGKMPRP